MCQARKARPLSSRHSPDHKDNGGDDGEFDDDDGGGVGDDDGDGGDVGEEEKEEGGGGGAWLPMALPWFGAEIFEKHDKTLCCVSCVVDVG